MNNRVSQTEMVFNHLKSGHAITPLEALERYGIFRLGARILEIRKQGFDVKTDTVSKNGKHFASYKLVNP